MHRTHSGYVYAGDALRRRARIKRIALAGAAAAGLVALLGYRNPSVAEAEPAGFSFGVGSRGLQVQVDSLRGELEIATAQLERAKRVMQYSSRYGIGADLAGSIFDIALAEGIDPDLAYPLVNLESQFNERATSPVGARGLTQLMLPTARQFDPSVTEKTIYERDRNLRIGFRYLRTLIDQYDNDVKLALLVYNRGPAAVNTARQMGLDPTNGYDQIVTRGYKGSGTVD